MQTDNAGSAKNNIAIRVSALTKNYGNLTAVDQLSFDIFRDEIFGFLGPNGAGKTTTINMISGLIQPTGGEIQFYSDTKNAIKTKIGICPQENIYWPNLTCMEQLIFMGEIYGISGKKTKNRANELLELMGLREKAKVLASKLSGGMKRRLNICMALIQDPEILILDEPEAGLDPQSRILVRNFIKTASGEKTVILTTHNMDEAERLADRVAIIDNGRLLMLDSPDRLKKSIGTGDVLEIGIKTGAPDNQEDLKDSLLKICKAVKVEEETVTITSRNLIEQIPLITEIIKEKGYVIKEMKLRENSLEDVFIHLTGRKLRQ